MKAVGYADFALAKDCHSLVETPQMHAFNLAFNPVAQILICTECGVQVRRKCSDHLRDGHRILKQGRTGREIDAIEAMFASLGVPVELRSFQPTVEPRLLIEGLNSTTVYGCSACPFSHSRRSKVRTHTQACSSPTAHVLEGIKVQRPNANRPYIRVEVPRVRAHAVLEQLLTVRAALRDEIADAPSDHRLVNPLLLYGALRRSRSRSPALHRVRVNVNVRFSVVRPVNQSMAVQRPANPMTSTRKGSTTSTPITHTIRSATKGIGRLPRG